jgi:hypothetical protein
MWIKTEPISVPAHKDQTTEVNINEWFIKNRSFLLGTPVANQMRGIAGGWVQTCAIAAQPGQNTIALLRDRLSQILVKAKGDGGTSPSLGKHNAPTHGDTIMATIIPADRFESNSPYSFILRENPKASGIEIQFPLDCTQAEWRENTRWTKAEQNSIRDRISKDTGGFVSVIEKEGFQQANGNPFLWWIREADSEVFNQKMTKARGWVKKCAGRGAYELDANTPVEQTKSRRRKSPVQPELSPNTPSTQAASGNKLADAIASVLLPQIVEAVGASQQTKELEREVNRLRMQVEELQELRTKYEVQNVTLANERDAALARVNEMEAAIAELNEEVEKFRGMAMELERDRDNLKLTLAELGLDSDVVQPAPEVNWDETPVTEPDTVSWDEEDELSLNSDVTQAASEVNWEDEELGESSESASDLPNEPDDTEEEEGFDLSSLGE